MHVWSKHMEMKELLRAGLTKSAAAKRLGVARRTVSRWQTESEPSDAQVGSVQGAHPATIGELPGVDGSTVVRGGSRGGLRWVPQSGSGLPAGVAAGG